MLIDRIGNRSQEEGFSKSRLPAFTDEEIEYINGTVDYLGINHYSSNYVGYMEDPEIGEPAMGKDQSTAGWSDEEWGGSASSWLKVSRIVV